VTRVALACVAILSSASACSSGTTKAETPAAYAAQGPAAAIDLATLQGGAPIATVLREGDPTPALALVVYAPGDAPALIGFAESLKARLAAAGVAASLRVDQDAAFISLAASEPDVAKLAEVAQAALTEPTRAFAAANAAVHDRIATSSHSTDPAIVAGRRCIGQLTLDAGATIDLATDDGVRRVEALRRSMRIALGFVGPREAASNATKTLAAHGPWARGPEREPTEIVPAASVSTSPTVERGRLTVAVRVASGSLAIEAATRLGALPSPLEARALALEPSLSLARAVGVARPDGGCVALTFAVEGDSTRDLAARVAPLVRASGEAVATIASQSPEPGAASRAVASTPDPLDAAALAAWWALTSDARGPAPTVVAAALETRLGDDPGGDDEAAVRSLTVELGPVDPASPPAPRVRVERGQGELFVLVANPCATATEPAHRWGNAAVATLAAAAHRRADADTSLEPFIDARAIGFVAHASATPGESSAALARRVGSAAAQAFFTEEARADELLLAQGRQTEVLEAKWGRRARGLSDLGSGLGDHPSTIEPFGTIEQAQRLDARALRGELLTAARGPIAIAVLANDDEAQGAEASRAAARWFSAEALAKRACPAPSPTSRARETAHGGRGPARAHIVIGGLDAPELAQAAAELLDGNDGLLAPMFRDVPGTSADARAAGAAVVLQIRAPDGAIDDATTKALELLARLARGEVPEAAIAAALVRRAADEQQRLADPRERLVRTLTGAPVAVAAPTTAQVRMWLAHAASPDRAAVSIVHPE